MESLVLKITQSHNDCPESPSPQSVKLFFDDLLGLLFPDFALETLKERERVVERLNDMHGRLLKILNRNPRLFSDDAEHIAKEFFLNLDSVYDMIHEDIDAMYEGDPAAKSRTEVIRCYPGFFAIATYRVAHLLHCLGVSLIPRMLTEYAHSKTGVDIHPGAQIGHSFCLDHGTGVVIGETTVIGNNVKIYQGVTLGALSVEKEDADKKRHPTIGDDVVIYAGATILGGKTKIGAGSIVGGNVWLTKSLPAKSKIYYQSKMYNPAADTTDLYIIKNEG
jgi:serine O-acetyltransferase